MELHLPQNSTYRIAFVLGQHFSVHFTFPGKRWSKCTNKEATDWIDLFTDWLTISAATPAALAWCWQGQRPSAPCLLSPLLIDRRSSSMNESLDARCWWFWIEMLLSGNTVSQSILPLHKQRRHSWGCAYKTCLSWTSFRTSLLLISPSKIMKRIQHNVG